MSVCVCVCDAADGFAMREGVRRVTHGGVCRVRELYCAIVWAEGVYFISSAGKWTKGTRSRRRVLCARGELAEMNERPKRGRSSQANDYIDSSPSVLPPHAANTCHAP